MKRNFIEKNLEKVTYVLEMIIAGLLAVGIIIGLVDLFKYFSLLLYADPGETYDLFQAFLGFALVLIVGVELMLMILHHSTKALLELVLFVIARKMLVYSHTMLDLVLGTLAIAVVFVILRYLIPGASEDIVQREGTSYSASENVKDILSKTRFNLPIDKGATVGNIVSNLAEEEAVIIEEGAEFKCGDVNIKVTKTADDGTVKEVQITNPDDDKNSGNLK